MISWSLECLSRSWTMSTPPRSAACRKRSPCPSQTRYRRADCSRLRLSPRSPRSRSRSCSMSPVWHELGASIEDLKPSNRQSSQVIIIGGGVIGLAVAWRLAQQGAGVVLLERGEPGRGASHVAAGMLAPVSEADPREEPLLRFGIASARAYPGFAGALQEASGLDPGYLRCGTLIAARDRDEAEVLERELQIRTRFGLAVRRLGPTEARRLEPALAPTLRGALEVADDHAVDPRRLTAALLAALRRAGAVVRTGAAVTELELGPDDAVRAVRLSDGERLLGEAVVVAAGGWSAGLSGLPPDARVPLRPVKGQ